MAPVYNLCDCVVALTNLPRLLLIELKATDRFIERFFSPPITRIFPEPAREGEVRMCLGENETADVKRIVHSGETSKW